MKTRKHYKLKIVHELRGYKRIIKEAIWVVFKKAGKLNTRQIDILVKVPKNKSALADLEGIGGYCPSPNFIQLSIDTAHKRFIKDPAGAISRSFAHELYHAARFNSGASKPQSTFLNCLIDEGLADQFVFELTGKLPIWNKPLVLATRKRLMKMLVRKMNSKMTDKDYDDWFIKGSLAKKIPRFVGYSLGLYLVRHYLKKYPKQSVKSLVATPAKEIVPGT